MTVTLSGSVMDVADAAGKLRANDPVICDPAVLLADIDGLLGAITVLQGVVVRRLRAAIERDATVELAGRA